MIIKQLTIFVQNEAGKLAEVARFLGDHGINIKAMTVADAQDFGIFRLIVQRPEQALELFQKNDFAVSLTDVICLNTKNEPCALANAIDILAENGINVEYMYGYEIAKKANIFFRVDDTERALEILDKHKYSLLKANDIYEA